MKRLSLICILLATLITATLCLTACNKGEYVLPIDDDLRVNEVVSDNYRTFYEIFVGAFSDSNGDGVGDLRGIINRLDYLNDGDVNSGKSLGVTGIWLMPVMPSPSYHKYDVSEYDKIDAKYGSLEDMKELVSKCHSRGVNVIIDLVLNHTSTWNAWFIQAQRAQQQCNVDDYYYGFYSVKKGTPAGVWYDFCTDKNGESWVYEGNFDRGMPELNWDNPHVKEQVEQVIKFWLDEVGIDGFRLDAVIYFYLGNHAKNVEVLQWINDTCKKYNPNAYVIAENWTNEQTIVDYYSACNCFDFPFSTDTQGGYVTATINFKPGSYLATRTESYYNAVKQANPNAIMAPFLSNHDMDRVAGQLSTVNETLFLASSMYLLLPGNPFIYYGEEIGMKGSRGSANTDANRRLAMLWGDDDTVKDPVGATYDKKLQTNGTARQQLGDEKSIFNHYKKVIALRNANPEIARGKVSAVTTFDNSICCLRYDYDGNVVYVLHNVSPQTVVVDVTSLGVSNLRGWTTNQSTLTNGTLSIGSHGSVVLK